MQIQKIVTFTNEINYFRWYFQLFKFFTGKWLHSACILPPLKQGRWIKFNTSHYCRSSYVNKRLANVLLCWGSLFYAALRVRLEAYFESLSSPRISLQDFQSAQPAAQTRKWNHRLYSVSAENEDCIQLNYSAKNQFTFQEKTAFGYPFCLNL